MSSPLPPHALRKLREVASVPAGSDAPAGPGFGRYRVLREIARGAMGVVYEAEDVALKRSVALKILRQIPGSSDIVRRRFQRESMTAAAISHPNVVTVYDAGEFDGQMYLAMELVQGRPLGDILLDRDFEIPPMLRLLEKAARGLAAAHEKGVVHRDVKPGNIIVSASGEPKIGDFGLAFRFDSETAITRTGSALGTPLYMSPEQVTGESEIRPSSDVYGLGSILYEILTGRPPHLGVNPAEIYGRIIHDDPVPVRRLNRRVPSDLEVICLKALEKDPARRYPTAAEFADDLKRHLDGEPILARPVSPIRRAGRWIARHRLLSAGIFVLLAAALLIGVVTWRERRRYDGLLAAGQEAVSRYQDLIRRISEVRKKMDHFRLLQEIPWDPDAANREETFEEHRELQSEKYRGLVRNMRDLSGEMETTFDAASASLSDAVHLHAGRPEAKRELARLHYLAYEDAERRLDRSAMAREKRLIEEHDPEELLARIEQPAVLTLDSRPTGAEIEIFRFEEGPDLRLTEVPFRKPAAGPVRDLRMPPGSYLVRLRKAGYRDVRYPVFLTRGKTHAAVVNLYTEVEIGKDFVYIPAGSFLRGGDPDAYLGTFVMEEVHVEDFFISRFETSMPQYREFIVDLLRRYDPKSVEEHLPRADAGIYAWRISPDGRDIVPTHEQNYQNGYAIIFISWDDADRYCRWLREKAERSGKPAEYRMPTSAEWEKAARGVDGRIFPWGNHFDWSYTHGFCSEPKPSRRKPSSFPVIGAYEHDVSPYGVRDMAGNVCELCDDWVDDSKLFKQARGGHHVMPFISMHHVSSRFSYPTMVRMGILSFRVVIIPNRDE